MLFAVLALVILAAAIYLRQTKAPPEPSAPYPPVTQSAPAPLETPSTVPQATPGPSTTQVTTTRSSAVNHAKVLVWKYLGEPDHDELAISRATNTVADIWDVSGQFAYLGSAARRFDAIVEKQKSGDWWLLGFS